MPCIWAGYALSVIPKEAARLAITSCKEASTTASVCMHTGRLALRRCCMAGRTLDVLSGRVQQGLRDFPPPPPGICDFHMQQVWHTCFHLQAQLLRVYTQLWLRGLLQIQVSLHATVRYSGTLQKAHNLLMASIPLRVSDVQYFIDGCWHVPKALWRPKVGGVLLHGCKAFMGRL